MIKYTYKSLGKCLLVLLAFTFITSCSKFLDEQPSTSIDANYVYNTEDGLKSGVVSLYKYNRDRYDKSQEDFLAAHMMASRSDLAFNRSGYLGLMGRYERGVSPIEYSATLLSDSFWRHYYRLSTKSTEIINAAEDLDDIEDDVRNTIIAEAKFFRAEAYFWLYRMFNNIYVNTESVTVDNAFDIINSNSSPEEILSLINSDLQFAIDHLEYTGTFGRVTKGTAKHVKAKVAMWEGNWAEAKNQAESLINEGPYSLVSKTSDVFKGNMDHSEQLFVIQFEENVLGGGSRNFLNANMGVKYWLAPDSESRAEYGGRGYSRLLPNNYLLDLLAEDPDDDRDNNTYFITKYYYSSGPNIGQEIDLYQPITDLDNPSDTYKQYYERTHPACLKFAQEDNDPTTYFQISNVMIYRLAETYLIAAEANMRLGGDGLSYINAVRERAGAAPISTLDEQAILDERARELAFEGHRWFTLKRMGQVVINNQIRNYAGDGEYFPANLGAKDPRTNWQDHYINFPIPQRDLDLLGDSYPQNIGY
ncbi:RagB/SusD family nutrient uptake outer membrane protein [Portibacter lacus]|uniref:Membrane protein n=1 Tax=Portibacter lacus TaxID=1099794 RepID=A0AA37SJ02_9BACT|nr:RagB/SusD family nutrient uptake outer membrane protein [Portibacter lacus]GLR15391.1 membrane protein [Portibacter lacus]